jgi:hypothetical protein
MSRGSRVASVLVFIAIAGASAAGAQTPDPSAIRVITEQYADGRVVRTAIRDADWDDWTPMFPRVAGAATDRDGLALHAMQFEHAIAGPNLVVTVALLYGSPFQKRVPVTTVTLTGERAVRVDELTAFGVQPISLSLASIPRPDLSIPTVTTPSSQLETSVEVPATGMPRYRISITNHAQQAVMELAFQGYRANARGLSGKPHHNDHTPLISPGETYTLTLAASPNGRGATPGNLWLGLDRIVFTSVTWSDGVVDGSERPALETRVVDAGTARQLDRVLTLMLAAQTTQTPDLQKLRAAVSALSIDDAEAVRNAATGPKAVGEAAAVTLTRLGMQRVKDVLLDDLDEFLHEPRADDPARSRAWLTSALAKFDGWRTRVAAAPR